MEIKDNTVAICDINFELITKFSGAFGIIAAGKASDI